MDTLIFAANSVLPIILVIFLGYKLKCIGFLNESFLKTANKLVFNICLPAYLFYNVYTIDSFSTVNWGIVLYCVIFILVLYFISLGCTLVYTKDSGKRGALIQCSFRSNFAIIGLTLAESIGGKEAVAIAAVLSAFSIPLFNVLAVITLSIFGNSANGKPTVKSILISISKNPLIRGVLLALVCLVIRKLEPAGADGEPIFTIKSNLPFLYKAIGSVSGIASPLALIVLGGQFTFSAVRSLARDIAYGTIWRLVITPFSAIAIIALLSNAGILNADSTCYPSLVALFGSPVAVSSAIMAEAMDCHGELARQLVVWTSLFSIITIFIAIVLLRSFGLI
jgi:hypothetical protein